MVYLVSFADTRLRRSLKRLKRQAHSFKVFDQIFLYDETDLPSDFKRHHAHNLVAGSRGYGYWCWKPQIIKMAFERLHEGDCLLYLDAGCHLNIHGKKRLLEYFELVRGSQTGILAFQANEPTPENSTLKYDGRRLFSQPNFQWIKGDAFEYFGVKTNESYTAAQAIGAGIILFRKCNSSEKILQEWLEITNNHFSLLDDSPSDSPNLQGFIEHRHDQAIWSLLCIKHMVKTLSAYEYYYPMDNKKRLLPDWSALKTYPIHAKRDTNFGLVMNACFRIRRAAKQIGSIFRKLYM
jgi:hypothetical protein